MPPIRPGGHKGSVSIYDDTFTMSYIEKRRSRTVLIKKPIPKSRQAMLRQIFDGFDYDGTGDIAASDLKSALYYIFDHSEEGMNARRSERDRKFREISEMVDEIDNDGSGEIDFDEFCEYMTSQEGNSSSKSKGGGQDISKLQDLFVNHQRGVQLDLLASSEQAETRAEEMTVTDSMKSFEFLFKTHLAGSGGPDEETAAKKEADVTAKKYYMTKAQRDEKAKVRVLPTLFVGHYLPNHRGKVEEDGTGGDAKVEESSEEHMEMLKNGLFALVQSPMDMSEVKQHVESFKVLNDISNESSWGTNVLLCEHNVSMVNATTRFLSNEGLNVTKICEDKEGLSDAIIRSRYDIVFVDCTMPGMGLDGLRDLKLKRVNKAVARKEQEDRAAQERKAQTLEAWAKKAIRDTTKLMSAGTLGADAPLTAKNAGTIKKKVTEEARMHGPLYQMVRSTAGELVPKGLRPVSLPGTELLLDHGRPRPKTTFGTTRMNMPTMFSPVSRGGSTSGSRKGARRPTSQQGGKRSSDSYVRDNRVLEDVGAGGVGFRGDAAGPVASSPQRASSAVMAVGNEVGRPFTTPVTSEPFVPTRDGGSDSSSFMSSYDAISLGGGSSVGNGSLMSLSVRTPQRREPRYPQSMRVDTSMPWSRAPQLQEGPVLTRSSSRSSLPWLSPVSRSLARQPYSASELPTHMMSPLKRQESRGARSMPNVTAKL